jgi:metal-responsive CopG/Arc/MetJ family transcriptional regulator
MKTAISIPDEIFKEIEKIAEENNCSRSEVFLIAVKEFLEKLKSKRLLEALNNAYSDIESREEKSLREKSKKYYAEKVMRADIDNKTR